jgi:serine/threonine protein kinase
MPLSAGEKLGPYEIRTPIGAAGMGEVYRARDTRLRRHIAIKVSAERFSEHFEKEARAIACLNHPNVCTLHDLGPNDLVMELVGGQTLAGRIKQGAIPLDEALAIAKQIAAALEPAHEKGITHRDLKPGNILTTRNYLLVTRSFAEAYGIEKSAISQRFDGDRWYRART